MMKIGLRNVHDFTARILALLFVTALASCGGGGGAPSVALGNMANVQVAMHMQGQVIPAGRVGIAAILLPGVQSVTITIYGAGFATIIDSFNATPGLAVTRSFQIPVGAVATFNVQGFNTIVGVPSAPTVTGVVTQTLLQSAAPIVVNIPLIDVTAPVITLTGAANLNVVQGGVYADAGATALDNVDGNITVNIATVNSVNTSLVGVYAVTYDVSDAAGNKAVQVVRTVNVTSPVVSGQFLYVNDNVSTISNTVSGFVINQTTGVLSVIPGSPFSTGGLGDTGFFARNNITLSRSRNLLFASNSGGNTISVFSIDILSGVLTAVAGSPFPNSTGAIMSGAGSAVVNQSGTLLFVGNRTTFDISVFSIAVNGALTSVVGSPFSAIHTNGLATFSGRMDGLRLNDSGSILYGAASSAVLGVGAFSIAANGALTPLQGSPFTGAVRGPTSFDLDAASGIAIGAGTGGKLTSYTIGAGGALTAIAQVSTAIAQVSTASNQFIVNLAGTQQCGEFSPDGSKYITSGGGTSKIAVVNVSATGQLSDAPGSSFTTIQPATGYSAIHPNGLWVYATERSAIANFVEFFTMAANGVLTTQQVIVAGARGSHNGIVIY